jgi:hypothetical protein
LGLKDVIFAVKAPVAEAALLSTRSSPVVGVPDVFQQTPWAVGAGTPRFVMLPWPIAVDAVIEVTAWVVAVGAIPAVVNDT